MDWKLLRYPLLALFGLALLIPLYVWYGSVPGGLAYFGTDAHTASKVYAFFRLFGLYAFTLAGLQLAIGAWRNHLSRVWDLGKVVKFHTRLGKIAFVFILAHPTFFVLTDYFAGGVDAAANALGAFIPQFGAPGQLGLIAFGAMALYLFLLTIITAIFRKRIGYPLWKRIHYLNYAAFAFALYHSWNIGSDVLSSDLLKGQWLLLGFVGLAGFINRLFELKQEREEEALYAQQAAAPAPAPAAEAAPAQPPAPEAPAAPPASPQNPSSPAETGAGGEGAAVAARIVEAIRTSPSAPSPAANPTARASKPKTAPRQKARPARRAKAAPARKKARPKSKRR